MDAFDDVEALSRNDLSKDVSDTCKQAFFLLGLIASELDQRGRFTRSDWDRGMETLRVYFPKTTDTESKEWDE